MINFLFINCLMINVPRIKGRIFILIGLMLGTSIFGIGFVAPSNIAASQELTWFARPPDISGQAIIYEHNVSTPFGACHADPLVEGSGNGHQKEYNIQWNRKDLPWGFVELINGSFSFNGYTVEQEPHAYKDVQGTNVTIRLHTIRNNTHDHIQAYLSNDTAQQYNLFEKVVGPKTFQILRPLLPNETLLVTYNKTPTHNVPLFEDYIFNHSKLGINYLPILDYGNAYLTELFLEEYKINNLPLGSTITRSGIWNWRRFVERTVARYANYTDTWEIYNEPNNLYKGRTNWLTFFEVVKAAAEEIREHDPSAKIIFGGLGGTDEYAFLDAIFTDFLNETHTRNLIDGIGFHPYPKVAEDLIRIKFAHYFETLNKNNWTRANGKEVYITEIGWDNVGAANSLEYQAIQIVKTMVMSADVGTPIYIYYDYHDDSPEVNATTEQNGYNMGLFNFYDQPHPGALAFNITSALLSNSIARRNAIILHCDPSLYSPTDHIYAYNFRRPDGTDVLALWQMYGTPIQLRIHFPHGLDAPMYRFNAIDGSHIIEIQATTDVQKYQLQLDANPLFITFHSPVPLNYIEIECFGGVYQWWTYIILPILFITYLGITIIYDRFRQTKPLE